MANKKTTSQETVDDRAQQLLKLLIERFIAEGQPVASSKLAKEKSVSLSSASVRNIMVELEAAGYLHSPHTSAGRVPTRLGYRFFVDSLLNAQNLEQFDIQSLRDEIKPDLSMPSLIHNTTRLLSNITKMAGIVTLPKRQQVKLQHIEFLPLSGNRILCILVLNERDVENRIIHAKKPYTQAELQTAANFLNTHFSGQLFTQELRNNLLSAMRQDQQDMHALLSAAIDAAENTVSEKTKEDYVLEGHGHLLGLASHGDIQGLRSLFDAFSQKQDILHLLDQCFHADGLQIFIGEESGYDALGDCSVVTAPYHADGQIIGALAVIGPTRMAYDKVIPIVDVTAKLLSQALKASK